MTDSKQTLIAEFAAACARAEAALAAVPATAFVLMWHNAPLHTDGKIVQMFGDVIYAGKPSVMIKAAAQWNRKMIAEGFTADSDRAIAVPAAKALQMVTEENAKLLALMNK